MEKELNIPIPTLANKSIIYEAREATFQKVSGARYARELMCSNETTY